MKSLACLLLAVTLHGQQSPPLTWTAEQDHQNMLDQLGIKTLRAGPSGNESAPNAANYDESKANPFPNLPEVLKLKNGQTVTTADVWWKQRRPEIIEDFEREVLGRVPGNVPKVTWTVTNTMDTMVGSYPAISKQLVGRVDNSLYPVMHVDIEMTVVTPAHAKGPVPVMMMLTYPRGALPARPPTPGADPPAMEFLANWPGASTMVDTRMGRIGNISLAGPTSHQPDGGVRRGSGEPPH